MNFPLNSTEITTNVIGDTAFNNWLTANPNKRIVWFRAVWCTPLTANYYYITYIN